MKALFNFIFHKATVIRDRRQNAFLVGISHLVVGNKVCGKPKCKKKNLPSNAARNHVINKDFEGRVTDEGRHSLGIFTGKVRFDCPDIDIDVVIGWEKGQRAIF